MASPLESGLGEIGIFLTALGAGLILLILVVFFTAPRTEGDTKLLPIFWTALAISIVSMIIGLIIVTYVLTRPKPIKPFYPFWSYPESPALIMTPSSPSAYILT
jgi:uncharacterized membrane-anchored protein